MASVACSETFISQLLAENAKLKTKLGIPEQERILQEILEQELQRFFDDAKQTLENAILRTFVEGNDEKDEQESGNNYKSQRVTALVEAVHALGAQNEVLLKQMNNMQTNIVANLNGKVEQLECERDTLLNRVLHLEENLAAATTAAASDEHLPPSLLTELRFLRASDAQLGKHLEEIQKCSEAAIAGADKLLKDDVHASIKLPHVLEQLEETRACLNRAEAENELLRLQLRESTQREFVLNQLRETQLEEEVALQQSTMQKLIKRLGELEAYGAETQAAVNAHLDTIAQLQGTIQSLNAKQAVADETFASKRQRLEEEILEDPNSVRREYITFWREGREELQHMRGEIQRLRAKERQLCVAQEKLAQMERTRSTVTSKLVTLADDICDARKENQLLRAQYAGLEVERDYLFSNLAAVISMHMKDEELERCCMSIREAAAKSAAASSSVVVDPQAIQQAMRQAQELKDEVAQLTRQKEKLLRYIALREERISTLISHEVLHNQDNSGKCGVVENMALAEFHTEDTLLSLEEAASSGTEGGIRRREKLLDMHEQLTVCKQKLEECEMHLCKVTAERDYAVKQLDEVQEEMRGTLAARESAISELLNNNEALNQSVSVLKSEKEQFRECYNASVAFTYKLSNALSGFLGLFRSEAGLVASLSDVLAAERAEVVELTRRSGEMWDTQKNEVQQVLDAIDRMCGCINQAVEQQQRANALSDTTHLCQLAEEVKRQEERLKEMGQTFAQACGELGESLAKRVTETQRRGDVVWKQRVKALMDERQQLQIELGLEKDFMARIEKSLLVASYPKPATSAVSNITATSENGPVSTSEMTGNNKILDAVNQLLASVSSQQGGSEVREKMAEMQDGENNDELKNALWPSNFAEPETEGIMARGDNEEEEVMQ